MPEGAPSRIRVRDVREADMPRIHAIYVHHVRTGLGSFEETPPDLTEMIRRRDDIVARRLPYVVAEADDPAIPDGIAGYAYAGPYRPRSAYRYSVEDSIYVAAEAQRRGVGRLLLDELVTRCTALGYRQMIAVIGDSANHGSIGVHEAAGFKQVALLPAIGLKFGRWVDSVIMQRPLGEGQTTLPAEPKGR